MTDTFDFGEKMGDQHRIGDPLCDAGLCDSVEYPKHCPCGGLIHCNLSFAADMRYTKCDKCGKEG